MKTPTDSQDVPAENPATTKKGFNRRGFFSRAGVAGAASMLPAATLMIQTDLAKAATDPATVTPGDRNILKFLAAAELVECDLWGQYSELANINPAFRNALRVLSPSLPNYVAGDYEDECSHANFINGFLSSIGDTPVNLDSFRTLPSSQAVGASQVGRLTNLRSLTIDTSFYNRYRSDANADTSTAPQVAIINNRPTIPLIRQVSPPAAMGLAQTAAFHFGAIEQGGASLYASLMTKVTNLDVLRILAGIGPTEFYHFAIFQTVLEEIRPLPARNSNGVAFPNIKRFPLRGVITPRPAQFEYTDPPVTPALSAVSVLRPITTAKAGAVAAATGLVNSGLFLGQPQAFLDAVTALAIAADSATRTP